MTPRKLTRLNPGRVYEIVLEASKGARPHPSAIPECTQAPFQSAPKRHSRVHPSAILECCKTAFWTAGIPPPGRLQTLLLIGGKPAFRKWP